jgi:hypothetical protein
MHGKQNDHLGDFGTLSRTNTRTHAYTHICGLFHSCRRFSASSLHSSLLYQPSSARSLASIGSFISSLLQPHLGHPHLHFSYGTHFSTFLGHLIFSILLVCPSHINCRFCTLSVISFPCPSFLLSFHSIFSRIFK